MSILFGGRNRPVINRVGGILVQTSLLGVPIPIPYGRNRISPNLIWYGDFIAVPARGSKKGGTSAGGSGKKGGGQFDYGAAVALALGQGPISKIGTVWDTQGNLPIQAATETFLVPSGGGYYIALQEATFIGNLGVTRQDGYSVVANDYGSPGTVTLIGTQQTPMVEGSISAGHYTQGGYNNATYFFSGADAGKTMSITYAYTPLITDGGVPQDPISTRHMTLFNGAQGQAPWGYLASNHPGAALGYSTIAYLANTLMDLGMSGTLPNMSFEVFGLLPFTGGVGDCNPSDVLNDIFTNPLYGCGILGGELGSAAQYSNYCVATGLFISPFLDSERMASDWVKDILTATNSELIESGGLLTIVPYGDTTIVANGVTYTPATQPIYDLTADSFIRSGSAAPVQVTVPSVQDAFNSVRIAYSERGNAYNTSIVEAQDLQAINLYKYRPQGQQQYPFFTSEPPAAQCAQAALARLVYIRNTYKFKLPQSYILLDPMDLVTVPAAILGMSPSLPAVPVRVLTIDEQDDRTLAVTAEEFPWGTAGQTLYNKQALTPGGPNASAPPGSVGPPIIFEALSRLNSQIGHSVWFGLCGAQAMSLIAADNFSRAALGANWAASQQSMDINADTDYEASVTGNCAARWTGNNPFPPDQASKAQITSVSPTISSGDAVGVAARMDPAGAQTFYMARAVPFGSTFELWKCVAGTYTNLATVSYTPLVGDVVEIRCTGLTVEALINGAVKASVSDSSIASGQPGIYAGKAPGSAPAPLRANNWSAWQVYASNPNWGGCRIWASLDGVSYNQIATDVGANEMGILTAVLPSAADPDTTDTLAVDLAQSAGALASFTAAETNVFESLCYVDGELIAYQNATLTSAYRYNLATLLRRGVYGSAIGSHAIGSNFLLLDDSVEGWNYDVGLIGSTVYFKFTSFNQSGLAEEELANVTAYPYTITGDSIGLLTPAHASYRPLTNPLTAVDGGSSATINVAAFSLRVPGQADIPFGSGAISGLSYNTLYYVYLSDPGFLPMTAPTYLASATKEAALDSAAYIFVGSIRTPSAGATPTIGNGDGGGGAQTGVSTLLGFSAAAGAATGTGSSTNPGNAIDGVSLDRASLATSAAADTASLTLSLPASAIQRGQSVELHFSGQAHFDVSTSAAVRWEIDLVLPSGTTVLSSLDTPNGVALTEYFQGSGAAIDLTPYLSSLTSVSNVQIVFKLSAQSSGPAMTASVGDCYLVSVQ